MDEEKIKILKDFLLDIDCLDRLNGWIDSVNFFDVLRLTRTEIRHSNMLAWLLNPSEKHGLGDTVLREFLRYACPDEKTISILLINLADCEVRREWNNIDIVVESKSNKVVLAIENKIDSEEHDNQLNRYKKTIENYYKNWDKYYLFLTPNGDESSDIDTWKCIDYRTVTDLLEKYNKNNSSKANVLINDYIETIRRKILEDEKLVEICQQIYKKHKDALDLIYENIPDQTKERAEMTQNWVNDNASAYGIKLSKCGKTYTRFTSNDVDAFFPKGDSEKQSGWNTLSWYTFEIRNDGKLRIVLTMNSDNMSEESKEKCNEYYRQIGDKKNRSGDWRWRILCSSKFKNLQEDCTQEEINNALNECYEEIKEKINKLDTQKTKD